MNHLFHKLRKEFLGIFVVTIIIIFFSVKRSTYADNSDHIENIEEVFTSLSQQAQPISASGVAGDALINEKITHRTTTLQQAKEQLNSQQLMKEVSHLQGNLALLQQDIPTARALLPRENTKESYFNHGTINLLDAYYHRQSGENESALEYITNTLDDYEKAQHFSLGNIDHAELSVSIVQGQQMYYIIAISLILETHQELSTIYQEVTEILTQVTQKVTSVKSNLSRWQFGTDIGVNACKQDMLDGLTQRQQELTILTTTLENVHTQSTMIIRTCLMNPLFCVADISSWHQSVTASRVQVKTLLDVWLLSYQRLEEIIARRDAGALRKLCEQTSQEDQAGEEIEQILNQLEEVLGSADRPQQQEEGVPSSVEITEEDRKSGLPVERDSEALEKIHLRTQERLLKTSELERDPSYTPEVHLQDLFEEFRGDSTGF